MYSEENMGKEKYEMLRQYEITYQKGRKRSGNNILQIIEDNRPQGSEVGIAPRGLSED